MATGLTTKTQKYPKVKVRTYSQDDQHAVTQHDWSSLLSLKDIQFLCLQDPCFPVKGHRTVSPPATARVPKSYVPSVIIPTDSLSEGADKKNDMSNEDRPDIRASPIPRPRAVLSSPDNDAIIGNNNRIKGAQPSALKNHKLIQNRHEQCKVIPSHIIDASPVHTRKSKNPPDDKNELKVKKGSLMEVSSERRKFTIDKPPYMRI